MEKEDKHYNAVCSGSLSKFFYHLILAMKPVVTFKKPLNTFNCLLQLMEALKEQEEINIRLRQYMDKIILNILDHNPSILEIKY